MASPISHIVYAKKYFDKNPSNINKDEFILGCVFPDIRRISEDIQRKDTHLPDKSLADLKISGGANSINLDFDGLSAFQAGWKFHLYCDMKREEILKNEKFYSLKNAGDFGGFPAKFLEDELVYEEYNNWEKIYLYFNNVPKIETGIDVSPETFALWYAILAKYIEKKPNEKLIHIFLAKQPSLRDTANEIVSAIKKLKENKKATAILKSVSEKII